MLASSRRAVNHKPAWIGDVGREISPIYRVVSGPLIGWTVGGKVLDKGNPRGLNAPGIQLNVLLSVQLGCGLAEYRMNGLQLGPA